MTSMAASTVPKFYKSVIDDVVNNVRELFLDDGVDEQVIQELRAHWERKITESRAIEHATAMANNATTNSTSSNSKSNSQNSKSKQSQAAAAAAAAAAASAANAAPGSQTSVITSNPNHITSKNGPSSVSSNSSNNSNSVRVKEEIVEEERRAQQAAQQSQQQQQASSQLPTLQTSQPVQSLTSSVMQQQPLSQPMVTNGNMMQQQQQQNLAPMAPSATNILRASAIVTNPSGPVGASGLPVGMTATPTTTPHLIQEVKYPTIMNGPGGQKVVLMPNNAGQYVMAPPPTQFVLTPEILSQLNLQGGILTTGPGGQLLHQGHPGLPSTIQYARAAAPTIQQVRTVAGTAGLVPGQLGAPGQPGGQNAQNAATNRVAQLDGLGDSSSDDEDEDDYRDNDDDQDDNDDEMNDEENDGGIEDEEPLNSGDDVSDEDPNELFETDNVVVCQYDKITRSRNKWKFHFKDGIMNLQGKDYVFQKAVGDAEW